MTNTDGNTIQLRAMKDRQYACIPIEIIVVVNSRDRDQRQFSENTKSIETTGLLKPIVVNKRYFETSKKFELVCGEGRLLAHKGLGRAEIDAEIIDVDRKQAHLMSLIENMARVPPGTMWFAQEVLRMKQDGMTLREIGSIVGRSETYVSMYLSLAEKGEDRLIRGVENGVFPISFAYRVADAGNSEIQSVLMDAYDANIVTSQNFTQVKRIINAHQAQRSAKQEHGGHKNASYTVAQLKRDIIHVTKEKEGYVRESENKENRLFAIIGALEILTKSVEFVAAADAEGLKDIPKLIGSYGSITSVIDSARSPH